MPVRAANEPPGHLGDILTSYPQPVSGIGQITASAAPEQAGDRAEACGSRAACKHTSLFQSGRSPGEIIAAMQRRQWTNPETGNARPPR
jgi:hypothetical protein